MTGSLTAHQTIALLLNHWHDIHDPTTQPDPQNGDPDGTPHMPSLTRSYPIQETTRCLHQLRTSSPTTYATLRTYYDSPTRIVQTERTRRQRNGRLETIHGHRTHRILPDWLDQQPRHTIDRIRLPGLVHLGINHITHSYRGTPKLPYELMQALTHPNDT